MLLSVRPNIREMEGYLTLAVTVENKKNARLNIFLVPIIVNILIFEWIFI